MIGSRPRVAGVLAGDRPGWTPAGRGAAGAAWSPAAYCRAPKIAVPMRTIVAPSAMAAKKSSVMPMER
jgi:hypothetical protein